MQIEAGHQAEIGYWIGVPYWGRGYCSQALRVVARHAFEKLRLQRLYARCFVRNPASSRVLQKLGFVHEGRQRQHVRKWDGFEDIDLYGLLKDEWLAARSEVG
jgi:RimJ/RimL family protein N-acetyltransferase